MADSVATGEDVGVRVCFFHSGFKARLDGCLAILLTVLAGIGYQSFFQYPALERKIEVKFVEVEGKITALQKEDTSLRERLHLIDHR